MKEETQAIRIQTQRTQYKEHSVPLYLTSSYTFDDAEDMRSMFAEEKEGNIYSRYSNPNVQEFIDKMCALERAESGWATASGMAAVFSLFGALLNAGDHIVSCRSVFGSTHKLLTEVLPRWNISATYVDFDQYEKYHEAILENTKILFIETPSNPGLDIIDLERLAGLCRKRKVLLVVDNCFATPILQRPLLLGADVVIHSATKYIDGQGRTLGGIILSSKEVVAKVEAFARHTGPSLSPFNAWVLSKSLELLPLRIEKHSQNALEIALKLEGHRRLNWVKYPHLKSHPQYAIAKNK
jgi:O-succinylhomoserine sulfhydrylase